MTDLPTDWTALCALVFVLGLRHAFDADHLAAIDGLTRLAMGQQRRHARWCGVLFCLGHGAVVLAVAGGIGLLSAHWAPPAWLALLCAWGAVAMLLALGIANLRAVLRPPSGRALALVGLRGPLLTRSLPAHTPWGVAAVGALFAVSFDTLGQAALFAATAARFGGLAPALMLGSLFTAGMLLADGLNGWWIAHLLRRADHRAVQASRLMGAAVAGVSLLVAAWGAGRLLSPALADWSEHQGLVLGALVLLVMGGSYLAALALGQIQPVKLAGAADPGGSAAMGGR